MHSAYSNQLPITSPDKTGEGLPNGSVYDTQHDPEGSFFVGDNHALQVRLFTKGSDVELTKGEIILLSKSEKDIGEIVMELTVLLELLPDSLVDAEDVRLAIKKEQDEAEQIKWVSSRGHYDPFEARELRAKTSHLEHFPILREAKRLCTQRPTERNKLIEMTVRRLVLKESTAIDNDAVQ